MPTSLQNERIINMNQLGSLAVICAKRPEVLMQVYDGMVSVYVNFGPERTYMMAAWDDDASSNSGEST